MVVMMMMTMMNGFTPLFWSTFFVVQIGGKNIRGKKSKDNLSGSDIEEKHKTTPRLTAATSNSQQKFG
ncbi:hypothetical protein K457DRAFT_142398 [Linnemannia elongata AG-77]|uniref:Uncharacterized protein n=1 Tax=Linnemannia elongata AG-77 TaxID=1314771 RepID=A0A197JFK4_9FUNG|nr:hypothetical protein K457DRAFT_1838226 [Linnemannia elongata AG-77]OAQ23957.1 hypothetical protein K457DRAFT_142398 [Linnemannia elongata AG-77]